MEQYQYVSPEYAQHLRELAESLVTPQRFGHAAVQSVVEQQVQ